MLKRHIYQFTKLSFKHTIRRFCDDFPKFTREDLFDENDMILNIGDKEKFKGLLVICPTPIGNINDISLRQYEALKTGDILACEDTRKTGKLLEMVQAKKMKERFYAEFGLTFDEFVDRGGLDMTDEQIEKEFFTAKQTTEPKENNYNVFYSTIDDIKKEVKKEKQTKKRREAKINKSLKKSKEEMSLANVVQKEVKLNYSEKEQKDIIKDIEKKLEDKVENDYYTTVKDSKDFYDRKTVIENSDSIKETIENLAKDFEDQSKLSYKIKSRAKFIMGLRKKYNKKSKKFEDEDPEQEDMEEEISLGDDNIFTLFKKRIRDEKLRKGRGLLFSFNQENEEKKIPKLIKAMKLGLRVILVSDAGTPTISDPGYKLVREAAKNNILMEALPGPSAVTTALSASAQPTDRFTFVGYLSKIQSERRIKLEDIKRSSTTTILFESPHRLIKTLEVIADVFGSEHNLYLGFELTKTFEHHMHGKVGDMITQLKEKEEGERGEITIVLGPYHRITNELEDERNLSEEIKIDSIELAKKLIDNLGKIPEKNLRHLLMDLGNLSSIKANKIINHVLGREPKIKPYLTQILKKND
jgi:16S rRNA (cytidine1402-2'-O)-methyltransferase